MHSLYRSVPLIVNCPKTIIMGDHYRWLITDCAFYQTFNTELVRQIQILRRLCFCFIDDVANWGNKLDLIAVLHKFIIKIFVVGVVEVFFIYQLSDARFKHNTFKMPENKLEIFGAYTFERFCKICPHLIIAICITAVSSFYSNSFLTLFNYCYRCQTTYWGHSLFKRALWKWVFSLDI